MSNSPWKYGCNKQYTIHIPKGFGYKEITVRCGSTAIDGGVNQCSECCHIPTPPVPEYGDIEHDFDTGDDLDYRRHAADADVLDLLEYTAPQPRIWEVTYGPGQSILGWADSEETLERFFPGASFTPVTDGRNNTIFDLRGY